VLAVFGTADARVTLAFSSLYSAVTAAAADDSDSRRLELVLGLGLTAALKHWNMAGPGL